MQTPARALLVSAALGALATGARAQCEIPDGVPPGLPRPLRSVAAPLIRSIAYSRAVVSAEREPNDAPAAAMPIGLGDDVSGSIDAAGDVDYFAVDLPAGTQLEFSLYPSAALFNPTQWLLDTDGVSVLYAHDWESTEHVIRFTVPTTGRYFVRVGDYQQTGGPLLTYRLTLRRYAPPPPGPGDPVTDLYRSGSIALYGIAVGAGGETYATYSDGVIRISPQGEATTFASGLTALRGGQPPSAIVVGRSGDVFVAGCSYPNGVIWRISSAGERSTFFTGPGTPLALTIGPAGDVWAYDNDRGAFWRMDSSGVRLQTIALNLEPVFDMAFSPFGDLCYTTRSGLYRLVDTLPQLLAQPGVNEFFTRLAFDQGGNVYVVVGTFADGGGSHRIVRFDARYHRAQDPVAQVGDHFERSTIADLAFARAANGDMTNRLVAIQNVLPNTQPALDRTAIVALSPAAAAVPGWRMGDPSAFTPDDIVNALLGLKALPAAAVQVLDGRGNNNGVLDVGDFRAYLRAQRLVP